MSAESGNNDTPLSRATAFFDLIHPAEGWRCLFTLPDRRHYWFQSSSELAAAALKLNAQGLAVFHSCAVFSSKSRTQDHVASLGCFWFDIDTGLGKPYPTAPDAYREFERWRQVAGLPAPVVVGSGGGLHVYWPLESPLPLSRWRVGAERLRALAQQHGLQIDAGSTIDSARILRPPGTHNRKLLAADGKKTADIGGPARPVQMGPLTGPYDIKELGLDLPETPALNGSLPATVPSYLAGRTFDDGLLHIGQGDQAPSEPEKVADACPQIRGFRENSIAVPEPVFHAIAGVLAYCDDGRAILHQWSAADPRYRPGDNYVDEKITRALKSTTGPTTCARFEVLNPLGCEFCPHRGKITSPIQLGRPLPVQQEANAPEAKTLPDLPKGFLWHGQRLCVERKPTEEDPAKFLIVSEYPILIGALQESERSRKISAMFRSWEPMAQAWREFVLNMGEVVGQGGAAKIADHGVVIPKKRWDDFLRYCGSETVAARGSKAYGVRYEQFGWKTGALSAGERSEAVSFVLGSERLVAGRPAQRVYGTDEVERRGAMMAPLGDLRRWTTAANKLLAHEAMEAHAFMLLCAFAAVLYRFTGEAGVTFVHGATRATAKGKTTIINAGESVWGEEDATSMIERDTMVAKFITLGTLAHLPVFFDELRFPTPDETKHYVLQATLGRDKQRGKAEGGLRADQLTWATIHISAANLSLVDTVRADGAEVAQAARVFEFTLALPEGVKTTEGDAIRKELRDNRGTAGRAFVQHVLDRYDEVSAAVPARMKHYEETMAAGPDERFVIRLFACVDVAAALIKQHGLLDVDAERIMAWAVDVQRGNAGRLAVEAQVDASAVIGQMMNDIKGAHMLVVDKAAEIGKPTQIYAHHQPRGELRARLELEGRRLLLDIVAVRRWLQEHHRSFTETQKELVALGVLKDVRVRKTLGAGTSFGVGQTWCWLLDGAHPLLSDVFDSVPTVEGNVVPIRVAK